MEITTATPHTWWLHARPLSPHDQGMLGWGMGSGTGRLLTAPDGEDFVVHVGEVVSSYRWCELHQVWSGCVFCMTGFCVSFVLLSCVSLVLLH